MASAIIIVLVGCAKSPETTLVGVWKESTPLETVLMTFRKDGSFVMTASVGPRSTDVFGNWAFDGAQLSVRDAISDGATEAGPMDFDLISLSDGALNLRLHNRNATIFSLVRQSAETAPPTQTELYAVSPEGRSRLTDNRMDKAVLNNARQLSAGADQYYLENGVSTVMLSDLIGPTSYVKELKAIAGEDYPAGFTQGITITIGSVAGVRTITYAP